MNLDILNFNWWIILINILLLTTFLIQIWKRNETFINYPQQVNPDAPISQNNDIETANNNYAALLLFIKNNPSKSANFIADIRNKFFEDQCKVKNYIDFNNIATFSDGVPFS